MALESLKNLFGETPAKTEQIPRFTPEATQLWSQLLGKVGPQLSFDPIRQQAMKRYQQETLPQMLHDFVGTGGPGSPSALGALEKSAREMETGLGAAEAQFNLDVFRTLLQNPPYENIYMPSQPGLGQSFLSGVAPQAGQTITQLLADRLKNQQQQTPATQDGGSSWWDKILTALNYAGYIPGTYGDVAKGLHTLGKGAQAVQGMLPKKPTSTPNMPLTSVGNRPFLFPLEEQILQQTRR